MTLQEIYIDKFPIIIVSDAHCCLDNLQKVKSLYPHDKIISLGDNCDLYARNSNSNQLIIQYLIDNKIESVSGNHDEHISGVVNGTAIMFLDDHNKIDSNYYNLPQHQCEWLKSLPRGFKLILPDNSNYLLYHNKPKDVWSFTDENSLIELQFIETYSIDTNTVAVVIGHQHKNYRTQYSNCELISLGALKHGWYGVITENGFSTKQL